MRLFYYDGVPESSSAGLIGFTWVVIDRDLFGFGRGYSIIGLIAGLYRFISVLVGFGHGLRRARAREASRVPVGVASFAGPGQNFTLYSTGSENHAADGFSV